MIIYYDYATKSILNKIQEKHFFSGGEFYDRIKIYITEFKMDPTYSYYPTLAFEKSNGRVISPVFYNGAKQDSVKETINGKEYTFTSFEWILSSQSGELNVPGELKITCYINILKGRPVEGEEQLKYDTLIKREVMGTFTNMVDKSVSYDNGTFLVVQPSDSTDDRSLPEIARDVLETIQEWEAKLQRLSFQSLGIDTINWQDIEEILV